MVKKTGHIEIDTTYMDYYTYLIILLQYNINWNLFTINEPLCPAFKEEILYNLCEKLGIEFIHPFKNHEVINKINIHKGKLLVYLSSLDENFL